jgi:uncharacterized protein with NRDE domain
LDTAWPKVERGKRGLERLLKEKNGIEAERLFHLLADRTAPPPEQLPATGVSRRWEQLLGPMFITSRTYGTRSSSVLLMTHSGRVSFSERSFQSPLRLPSDAGTRTFHFHIP